MNRTIVRAVQTCQACPSQWDAWNEDGQYLYLRYRGGIGTVEVRDSPDYKTWDARKPPEIAFQHGDGLDGVITLEEFAEHALLTLALPGGAE